MVTFFQNYVYSNSYKSLFIPVIICEVMVLFIHSLSQSISQSSSKYLFIGIVLILGAGGIPQFH